MNCPLPFVWGSLGPFHPVAASKADMCLCINWRKEKYSKCLQCVSEAVASHVCPHGFGLYHEEEGRETKRRWGGKANVEKNSIRWNSYALGLEMLFISSAMFHHQNWGIQLDLSIQESGKCLFSSQRKSSIGCLAVLPKANRFSVSLSYIALQRWSYKFTEQVIGMLSSIKWKNKTETLQSKTKTKTALSFKNYI